MFSRKWILFCILSMIMIFSGCTRTENQSSLRIQDFSVKSEITADDNGSEDIVSLFSEVLADLWDISMKKAGNGTQEKFLILSDRAETAENLHCSFSGLEDNAFIILYQDNNIYLLSPTPEGAKRAVFYFVKNYISQDGTILPLEERYVNLGSQVKDGVYVGDTSIEEYTLTYSAASLLPICRELQYYISETGGGYLPVQKKTSGHTIKLSLNKNLEAGKYSLSIESGDINLAASDSNALYRCAYLFLDTYLGWRGAGTENARLSSSASVIHIPENVTAPEDAWIPEREAIITLWNVNFPRGIYLNSNVSLKNNLMDYSGDQLYEYVKMLKYCGFTGIQVTDMCSAWAGADSYEPIHEKIRILADSAHSLDMKFTLWVWGAEFSDYGWVDPDAAYSFGPNGEYPHTRPEVIATFEKYYSIYAQLADCCDRVIAHYFDPGNLVTTEDVAYFAKMLKDKFLAVNPEIDFGVSCWVDAYDKNMLVKELGNDITLYEEGHHDDIGSYTPFRTEIVNLGTRLGTWAWNTCEMEIDQLAQMNFNLDIIRSVYQTARNYDSIIKPSYWSEMDSYHVLNVFSLYCAGQMLINPDIPSEDLYESISTAAVGPEYAGAFAEMLKIIQDARSGHSWDTYFWSNENYILKSDDYPAEDIFKRCTASIPILMEMIHSGIGSYTLPLPISLQDLLSMMLSHMKQIQSYAAFRIGLSELEQKYAEGSPVEELEKTLYEIAKPIDDYDCIIGCWGQIEARAQYEMITAFCQKTGMDIPVYPEFHAQRKQYIMGQFICYQRNSEKAYLAKSPYYQWGLAYGADETARLVNELVAEGLLTRLDEDTVCLKNWESYTYHFK